ncbi:thiamine-phosphate pyrophosphorylase [Enterococcus sp. DIV1094]|uniref:Thiamine-phosphate synthase n=1 Tax=Candidatus Enterococcus mangumiae TaxID=2230878 RepID=A0ABZ2T0S8_9ENTE|nr:thiamine phosphate synthase [Enterococcus sp. DIV1094]
MLKNDIDYRLYLVTDQSLLKSHTLQEAVKQALDGEITVLQLREKAASSRDFFEEAHRLKELTDHYGVPLIINDRVDIALACDADGVHVGQTDLPVAVVRKMIGPEKIIGASVQTVEQAILAEEAGADYLGVGAMFPTSTKSDAIEVTKTELKNILQHVSIPVVLIGGLNERTIAAFKDFPIQGFAVVSAILAKQEIKKATQELFTQINKFIK